MVKRGLEFKFDLYLFFRMDYTVDHLDSSPRKMECDRVTRQESGSRISRHTPSSNRSMALESSSARSGLTQNALPNLSILPCPRNYPSINHHDKIADKEGLRGSAKIRKLAVPKTVFETWGFSRSRGASESVDRNRFS